MNDDFRIEIEKSNEELAAEARDVLEALTRSVRALRDRGWTVVTDNSVDLNDDAQLELSCEEFLTSAITITREEEL